MHPGYHQTDGFRLRCSRVCVRLASVLYSSSLTTVQVRVGELLLEREREETEHISHLAQELLDKEYRTPSRELQCRVERAACQQCYMENAANPSRCSGQVEAFAKCADAALRVRASLQSFAVVMTDT